MAFENQSSSENMTIRQNQREGKKDALTTKRTAYALFQFLRAVTNPFRKTQWALWIKLRTIKPELF